MRSLVPVALLVAALLAGCVTGPAEPERDVWPVDIGYDPATITVTGTRVENVTIPSFDGATTIAAVVRIPVSNDTLPGGGAPRWPVILFLHGWGGGKESYTGGRGGVPMVDVPGRVDRLAAFAEAGFIAVAYDARGYGQSGGHADVAGPATLGDLSTVIDWVEARYPASGRVGLFGESYGAGQALLALAKDSRVDTVVAAYGWGDLAESLVPGNVPKLEWGQFLYAYGLAGSHGRYDAMLHSWYRQLYTRDDMATMRAEMAVRSALPALGGSGKPLLVCQGLQETLFAQADLVAAGSSGFTRTYVYPGGHGSTADGCWSRAVDWFHFFLGGYDTHVDRWPLLETSDALAPGFRSYAEWPVAQRETFFLRAPDLGDEPSAASFTIRQALAAGTSPSAVSDLVGGSRPPLPEALNPPAAWTLFNTPRLEAPRTLLGSATLRLDVESGVPPFQVVAELVALRADGKAVVLAHAAAALLEGEPYPPDGVELRFEWTHAELAAGDRVQLRVAANDPGWWMPLLDDYSVTFAGTSSLELPFL